MRQLEDENARLKRVVADLTLDKHMLAETLRKNLEANVPPGASNRPLLGAQVAIPDRSLAAVTDSAGFARLPRLPTGAYTVRVRAIGYKPATDTLTIPPLEGRFLIVQLAPDVSCLPYPL